MSREPKMRNAKIVRTMLGIEDHGILTCSIETADGALHQGFGGYAFDGYDETTKKRHGTAWGMEFIRRTLSTLGVEEWEKLPGTPCRIVADSSKIYRIGHFIEERWFDPETDLANFKEPA